MASVMSKKEREQAEEQRRILNKGFAVIRGKSINHSLRTLLKLVEKKQ